MVIQHTDSILSYLKIKENNILIRSMKYVIAYSVENQIHPHKIINASSSKDKEIRGRFINAYFKNSVGTPDVLQELLGISRATLYRIIAKQKAI